MRLHHAIVARSSRCGSLVTSLLCASMALAETLDPAEHLNLVLNRYRDIKLPEPGRPARLQRHQS